MALHKVLLTCVIVYQYCETNVMHIVFNLRSIKGLYMFWALLTYPQEALHNRYLIYCVIVMSVGYTRIGVELLCFPHGKHNRRNYDIQAHRPRNHT
jgi:hypothetical protein